MRKNKFRLIAETWIFKRIVTHEFTHNNLDSALIFANNYCNDKAMSLIAVGNVDCYLHKHILETL